MKHKGSCHCGAIEIELETDRLPKDQVVGACQCSFCRKHNPSGGAERLECGRSGNTDCTAQGALDANEFDRLASVRFRLTRGAAQGH
jgi:hypothetical protein